MSYDIIPSDTDERLFYCIHNAKAGVSSEPNGREFFKTIFHDRRIDYYICENAKYLVKTGNNAIILDSLNKFKKDRKGYYIENTTSGEKIYLSVRNFSIICSKKCHHPDSYVEEYIPKSTESENCEEEIKFSLEELPYEKVEYP